MLERFTYLALLIGWAAPVIALHWIVGAPELRARLKVLAIAVLVPTVYLSLADAVAIGSGVWAISEELTVGWRAGSLVFEEALFFFLTNVLVAQSIILFLSPSARDRADRIARSLLRRPRPPAAVRDERSDAVDGSPRLGMRSTPTAAMLWAQRTRATSAVRPRVPFGCVRSEAAALRCCRWPAALLSDLGAGGRRTRAYGIRFLGAVPYAKAMRRSGSNG